MKNKLKIAVYSSEIPSTTFVERLIEGLAGKDHQLILFGKIKKKVDYKSTNIKIFGFVDTPFWKFLFLFKYTFLLYFFRNKDKRRLDYLLVKYKKNSLMGKVKFYPVLWHKPAVFHLQWAKGILDWMWVQDFGIKLVVSLRGTHTTVSPVADLNLKKIYQENFPKVDGFHAVSKAIGVEALKYGAPVDKIKVVYSGLSMLNVSFSVKNVGSNKTIQLLSVGRSHWIKGYNYALDACILLKRMGFNFHYTIIGAKEVEELEYQRADLGLTDCVTFLGSVPYEEVLRFMQETHIVLLPSVEEGIANVVLEAMMLEKLVLTTDCGGMEEIVQDGINGFVVPIRNPESISAKIVEMSKLSEDQITTITTNAKKTIESINSEEKMVAGMEALYGFVLKDNKP